MGTEQQEQAVLAEERALQAAMRASDVQELERLLHPRLLAVGPDGRLVDRATDLDAHRTGVTAISELEEEEVRVLALEDVAVTFVVLRISATVAGAPFAGRLRYTRTWTSDLGVWRVVAAHIGPAGD